jgi:hypothetical protein
MEKGTLDAIAQRVGVTKGAFYSYFSSSNVLMQPGKCSCFLNNWQVANFR